MMAIDFALYASTALANIEAVRCSYSSWYEAKEQESKNPKRQNENELWCSIAQNSLQK